MHAYCKKATIKSAKIFLMAFSAKLYIYPQNIHAIWYMYTHKMLTQPGHIGVQEHCGLLGIPAVLVEVIEEWAVGDGGQVSIHVTDARTYSMKLLSSFTPAGDLGRGGGEKRPINM